MSSLVIVAIPSEDDRVMDLSSEKVPHLTLLFLGEAGTADDVPGIIDFVEHASKKMQPFWLEVDHRGLLGPDDADVLFFEKGTNEWSDFKRVDEFREMLKGNPAVKAAYNTAQQYPEWRPHLTMGYPATPAKEAPESDRMHGRIGSVSFDRIAVWDGDFAGPEFRLTHEEADIPVVQLPPTGVEVEELVTRDSPDWKMVETAPTAIHTEIPSKSLVVNEKGTVVSAFNGGIDDLSKENALEHHGVKGMRWGVRSDNSLSGGGTRKSGTATAKRPVVAKTGKAASKVSGKAKDAALQTTPKARHDRKQAKRESKFPSKEVDYRVTVGKKGNRQIETRGGSHKEPAPEAVKARILNQQRKASGLQSLSNKELQDLATRINLEQQVQRLTAPAAGKGVVAFVKRNLTEKKVRDANINNALAINDLMKGKLPTQGGGKKKAA